MGGRGGGGSNLVQDTEKARQRGKCRAVGQDMGARSRDRK